MTALQGDSTDVLADVADLRAGLEQAEERIARLEGFIVSAFGEDDPEGSGEVTTRWRAAHEAARARRRRERGR